MTDLSWNEMIRDLPHSHFLQTEEWAEVKKEVGWKPSQLTWKDESSKVIGAANILVRRLKILGIGPRISIGYIPRGPMIDWENDSLRNRVLDDIQKFARQENLVFLKMDPEIIVGMGIPDKDGQQDSDVSTACKEEFLKRKWKLSGEQIQFKNTAVLELSGTEEDWLKRMKQKARYNLRLAQRSGVNIRIAIDDELPALYQMYAQTAARDGFIIREMEYYLGVWRRFIRAGMADALIAEVDGQAIAGLVLFHFGKRAWYFYGMSTTLHREKMPNYLLQWEAMRLARSKGCEIYDLWGAPDQFSESDRMYGVFRFKDGLGAVVVRTWGAWDYPVKPALYALYQQVLPRILDLTRWLRRGKLRQETN